MSILKLSKNDIIRNEDKEGKIKLKRSNLSYDSAMVSGWEQTNRQSLDILNDYNNRINKSEWLDEEDRKKYRSALDSYIETSNYLRGINKTFGEGYTDEDEQKWADSIASMNSGYDEINKYYSQFASDKVYNNWQSSIKADEEYNSYFENIDAEKGAQGRQKYLDDEKAREDATLAERENASWWDKASKFILEAAQMSAVSGDTTLPMGTYTTTVNALREDQSYRRPGEDWTEDQLNKFGELYLQSPVAAYDFAEETNKRNAKKKEEDVVKKIQDSATSGFWAGLGNTVGAIATAPFGLADYLNDLAYASAGREITPDGNISPFEYSQAVTSGISTNLNEMGGTLPDDWWVVGGKGWGDAYGLGTSIAQSMASAYTLGGVGTLVSYFGQGAAAGVDDALSRGATDEQALLYGAALGTFEGVAEKMGIDNLFKLGSADTVKGLIKNILKQAGAEGMEEGATAVFSNIADAFIMQDKSNFAYQIAEYMNGGMSESDAKWRVFWDSLEGIAFDTIAGAVSGSVSGGLHSGVQTAVVNADAKKNYSGQVEGLLTDAASVEGAGKTVDKLVDKYGKTGELSGWDINHLLEITDSAKVKSAVEAQLTKLGESGDVSKLADVITKQAQGIELSKKEQAILDGSTYGQRIVNTLDRENIKSGMYDTKWAKGIGTRRLNADVYNKSIYDIVEDTANAVRAAENATVTENATAIETATEGKIAASANAKITIEKEGKVVEVKPQKIASLESDGMTIELEGGEVVDASEVDFGDSGVGLVYQAAKDMASRVGGFSVDTANVFVRGYNAESGVSAGEYVNGWISSYKFGAQNSPVSVLATNAVTSKLSEAQRKTAYNFGRAFGNEPVAISEKGEGFVGEYTKRAYSSEQAELLSALPVEGLQNAVDSNGALSFNAIGLGGEKATQQKWIDAGLTYTEDGKVYVDENAVLDERDRRRKASKEAKNAEPTSKKEGKVYFDGAKYGKTLNERQRASLKALRYLSKALGVDIHIFESPTVNGKRKGENGWYDSSDRSIHIDLYAGAEAEALMIFTAAHELTHHIREVLPDKFNVLADAIFEEYTKRYGSHAMEHLVDEKKTVLKEKGRITEDMSDEEAYDLAYEEVIADCCETLLVDSNAIEALSKNIYAKDKGLWETIKNFIAKLVARIKAAFNGVEPDSEEGLGFRALGEGAERIKKLWVEAIVEASEVDSDIIKKDVANKDTLFNLRAAEKHKLQLEEQYTKDASISLNTLMQRYNKILSIWEKLGGELNSKFLKEWDSKIGKDRAFTVFKAQAGYKYNVELSSMCKKGVPLFEAIDTIVKQEVMKELDTEVLGKEEKEILYDILKDHNFEIPCAICYVEQARQREGVIIDAFLNGKVEKNSKGQTTTFKLGWNEVLKSIEKEMKANGVDYTFAAVDRSIATDKYSPADITMDEATQEAFYNALKKIANKEIARYNKAENKNRKLVTSVTPAAIKEVFKGTLPSNLKIFKVLFTDPTSRFTIKSDLLYSSMTTHNLANSHNALYSLFNSQGGVSGYKTKQGTVVYWGDILGKKWTPSKVRDEGGIRNQSNSDFQMYTLLDQAQMYIDFTAKGYYLQAYTKVLAELKLFGLSRGKINASLIPAVYEYKNPDGTVDVETTREYAGLDANGELLFDDFEGINHAEAFMLLEDAEYSKSLGGICIGYSDNHILKLLDDQRVQQIIGFHDKTDDPNKRYRGAKYSKNYNGLNEAVKFDKDGKPTTVHIGFNPYVRKAEKKFKYDTETETYSGEIVYNGKTYVADDIPKLAADMYLDMCEEKGYDPAYKMFAFHENYYKLLADFSLYDSEGHYAPHRKVAFNMPDSVPYLDSNGNKKYMPTKDYIKAELQKELKVRDSISEALADTSENGIIPQFKKAVNEAKKSRKKASDRASQKASLYGRDSLGNELSEGQIEFFKDSKARDEDGNLLVLYHGTSTEQRITEFKTTEGWRTGLWLTTDHATAVHFAKVTEYLERDPSDDTKLFTKENSASGDGRQGVYELYANVKNPLIVDAQSKRYWEIPRPSDMGEGDAVSGEEINAFAFENGYDGVIIIDVIEGSNRLGTDVIVFAKNQVKYTDNLTPTEGNDIRYSDRASKKASNIGYHAGDLGKAEFLNQQGYYRGTGHFGTGTYFVGDEAKISGDSSYGKRPHHAVDFSNYNLYKVKSDKDGYDLHEQLRVIDGGISQEWLDAAEKDQFRLVSMVDVYDLAEERFGEDKYSQEAMESAIHELAEKHGIELLSREEYSKQYDIPLDDEDFLFYYVEDYLGRAFKEEAKKLDSAYGEFRDAHFSLKLRFGYGATKQAFQKVIDYYNANADTRFYTDKKDSLATVFMKALGYEGIDVRGTRLDNVEYGSVIYDLKGDTILYSDRAEKKVSYAPIFYSHMGKVIDDVKLEKMGTSSILNHLKNRGVKDEEIKWSGIETFLEGKKSVTKAELQEFIAGSQLVIEEEMSDPVAKIDIRKAEGEDYAYALYDENGNELDRYFYDYAGELESEKTGETFLDVETLEEEVRRDSDHTRWSQFKLDGGENYRELVFKLPNSSYSNRAMRGHWGQDAEGILVHARMQDFEVDGKKMLFIEELQSDWHNEGHEKGYSTKEYEDAVDSQDALYDKYKKLDLAFHKYVRSNDFMSDPEDVRKKKSDWLRGKSEAAYEKYLKSKTVVDSLKGKGMGDVADAPFKNNYHEYVLKRLLRMAAEEGYDSIGWTPAYIQSDRWSEDYAEAYRIEYDQEMPKFLRKYGKKWGATVGKTTLKNRESIPEDIQDMIDDLERDIEQNQMQMDELEEDNDYRLFLQDGISDMQATIERARKPYASKTIWSMEITDSMTESVLYEGQVMYSDRVTNKKTLDFLENQEHITTYKSFVEIDGKLYSPMATKVKGDDGKYHLTNPSEIGVWQQAEEKPESIPKFHKSGYGYYVLKKDDGGSVTAAYNPYEHSSNLVLNDQFEAAYQRPNLVTVECVIPKSEMTSGYKAKYAKDSTGYLDWKSGTVAGKLKGNKRKVYLSRWLKPVRILSDAEVASMYKDILGSDISVPFNVVTPQLLAELEKVGVKIDYEGSPGYQYRQSKKADGGDTKLSDRNPNSFSNRSLLAGALETAAQNDIEREKLKQYKEKIDLINSEEQKLSELRAQIKELSFKKGARDAEAIKSLQFEANQAANRINTYDKQLLNLESTKALKGVLEREKAMLRKRIEQKAEQRRKEDLTKAKERAAKTERELMNRYQESRQRATESRNKTAMRHKIKGIVSELNTLLLNPTAKKHIKEELRKEVADALSAINMDTVDADARVAKYNALIARENDPDIIDELVKTRDNIQLQGDSLKEKLNNLQMAYEKIKNTEDIELNLAYQEVIQNSIKAVSEKVGNTSIRNMTLEQLEMVYDLFKMIRHTIREANKSFKAKKGETIMQMAEAVNDQVRTVGGQPYKRNAISAVAQRAVWTFLKPYVAFRTIGSVTLTNLYKNLRAGEDTFYGDVREAQEFIEAQYEKHGYKSWDMKKTKTFTAKSGKTFELTLEQMMSLYAYYKREKSHKHIMEGGIVFEDTIITEKNKWGIPIKYKVTTKDAFNLSEETFKGICDYLEKEHKDVVAFVNEMQAYLSDTMGAKGNEVSMELLGVKLFKEKFYLPIKSSQYYMNFNAEEAGEIKLKSPAFSKETVPHANNPIVLHNFTDLWAEHINDMSMYHAFVLALEDFTRVYNYKTKTGDKVETMDTKATLETAYPGVTNYINKFLKDMNGGVRGETVGWAETLTSLSKKGAVLGSASVVIQQPSAVMRAMAMVDPKYFVTTAHKSVNLAKHKQDWEELKKYAPIAGIKEMGRFDVGMGQGTVDWIKSNKTALNKVEDGLSAAPAYMDEVTWVSIWNAVKRETANKNPKLDTSSEEFLKLAGERFTDVISLTQVYDSVFSRSDLMRNKSVVAKWLTAFMAEPSTTLNMLWDSWVQAKRTGGFKAYAKATTTTGGAVMASIVLNAALKSIVMAMRDDDEDESYAEKYLEHFAGDLKDSLNPLTLIPVVKDIVSIFKGYDVERMDMALFSDLKKALDAFDSDSKTVYEKWSGLVGAISAFFGVPIKNVERDIRGLITTVFGETEETTLEGMLNAIKEGWTGKDISNGKQLYDAYLKGDAEQIERVKGRFEDENAANTALRKALRENDPRIKEAAEAFIKGDYNKYNSLREEIISEGNFSRQIVTDALKAEYRYLKEKAEEGR